MKRNLNVFYIVAASVIMLALGGCKTNSLINCPDFASERKAPPLFVSNRHSVHHSKSSKPACLSVNAGNVQLNNANPQPVATAAAELPFKIKMPSSFSKNLEDDKELADMNGILVAYSSNKVALQRNDKGKLFLKAQSIKDIFALAQNTSHPQGYYERRYGNGNNRGDGDGSGAAIASSILGPISFVFAFIPFLSLAAIPISIAAIITGGIGMRSPRQRRAAAGLTFGILGLIIGILFSIFYVITWGIVLL